MNSREMIYMMNVDWNWIKQRPHFIAELLNEKYNVHVMYQHRYNRNGLQQRDETEIDVKPIYVIPRGDRYSFLSNVNKNIKSVAVKKRIKDTKAGIIYLTFPDQVSTFPDGYKGIVLYDCMDNHPAFIHDIIKKEKMILQEQKLINRADIVLVSSEHLKKVLLDRYGKEIEKKIYLVRNGYNGDILDVKETMSNRENDLYTFAYFGTISSWFNFDYIVRCLDEIQDIRFDLFGPIDGVEIPKHEKIHYHGTVEHDSLLQNIKNADCLIMPFIVNDIIESVDPVKLYEYINFNKNILVSRYREIERFDSFAYFYSSYEEFKNQILKLKNNNKLKYNEIDRHSFLLKNNWKCRAEYIHSILMQKGIQGNTIV